MDKNPQSIDPSQSDKVTWLAGQIFTAFPQEVSGLKIYTMDCGCIYYQRLFRDGDIDSQVGIYRDADQGPCEVCMRLEKDWKDRMLYEVVVYSSKFQIEKNR